MPLPLAELQDRFRAAVLGFAIGDALGFPLRGMPPASVARNPNVADDFAPRPRSRFARGQFSDDTQVMLAMAEAVAREQRIDGRAAGAQLAWLWQEGVILQPPQATSAAAEALLHGTPWMSAGAAIGVKDPSCLSRGLVVGLFSEATPNKVAHDAGVLTVITHKDATCAAATAAFARAVQLMMEGEPRTPADFCGEVSKAAAPCDQELADELFYLPRALPWDADRAMAQLRRISVPHAQLEAEPGIPALVTPVLLCALYAALKVPHDFREAMALVLRQGGEVDVAAGITGALLGAGLGTQALPPRLKKSVLYGEALLDTADRLFDARLQRAVVAAPSVALARR